MERKLSRRRLLGAASAFAGGSALAGAAGNAIGATAAMPAAKAIESDSRIAQLIADYERKMAAFGRVRGIADRALFEAFPDPYTRPLWSEKLPPEIQQLYDASGPFYEAMNEAYDRAIAAPCRTLRDLITKLEWPDWDADPDDIIAEIRTLAAGGAA
jgi:hypothetical protein